MVLANGMALRHVRWRWGHRIRRVFKGPCMRIYWSALEGSGRDGGMAGFVYWLSDWLIDSTSYQKSFHPPCSACVRSWDSIPHYIALLWQQSPDLPPPRCNLRRNWNRTSVSAPGFEPRKHPLDFRHARSGGSRSQCFQSLQIFSFD